MAFRPSADPYGAAPAAMPLPVKLVVAGGFGVGKTTAVSAISEVPVLSTEAAMTTAGADVDRSARASDKTTTTVALDFGRLTIDDGLALYLFGTPGQDRFGFLWDDITRGALGALVIVDTARMDDCYPAVDYFERSGTPFVVGVNMFDGELVHDLEDVRWALDVDPDIPLVTLDARSPASVRDALLAVLERALQLLSRPSAQGAVGPPR